MGSWALVLQHGIGLRTDGREKDGVSSCMVCMVFPNVGFTIAVIEIGESCDPMGKQHNERPHSRGLVVRDVYACPCSAHQEDHDAWIG